MSSQEQNIEKIFKDTFDEFTPDVSAKVWSGVSQQLLQPVAPLAQPGASLLKTAAVKLSTAGTWIIGGIAAIAIVGGVVMYQEKNSNKVEPVKFQSPSEKINEREKTVDIASPSSVASPVEISVQKSNPSKSSQVTTVFENIKNEVPKSENNYKADNTADISTQSQPAAGEMIHKESSDSHDEQQSSVEKNIASDNTPPTASTNVNKPEPLILVNSTTGFAPFQLACLLNNEGLNGDWDFGDGSIQPHSSTVTHKYAKPGTYILKCNTGELVLTKTIEVIGKINTAFSPNGDGINDFFLVEGGNMKQFSLKIFDRNGRQMTELNNITEKWDGRLNGGGSALPGTYFYELSATTENGNDIRQRGSLNLFK